MLQQTKDAKEAWEESEEQDEAEHDAEDDLDAIDKRLAQEEEEVWRMRNYGNVSLKNCLACSLSLARPVSCSLLSFLPVCHIYADTRGAHTRRGALARARSVICANLICFCCKYQDVFLC